MSGLSYEHTGSGAIYLSSSPQRNYNASFDFGISFTHQAYGSGDPDFNLDFDFNYTISAGKLYWYRVLFYCQGQADIKDFCPAVDDLFGDVESTNINPIDPAQTYCKKVRMRTKPIRLGGVAEIYLPQGTVSLDEGTLESDYIVRDSSCGELQGYLVNIKCAQKKPVLMTMMMASDLEDLCSRFKKPLMGPEITNFRICAVAKFITPVNESAGHGLKTELQMEDISNIGSCIDYNLDFNLTNFTTKSLCNNRFVFHSFAKRVFYHEPNLKLQIKGQSNIEYSSVQDDGFIILYSVPSRYEFPLYTYPEPDDSLSIMSVETAEQLESISLNGNADFLVTPIIKSFSGGLHLSGSLSRFIFPFRTYNSLVDLELESNSKFLFFIKFDSYNLIEISNELELLVRNNFSYLPSSVSLGFSGKSETVSSYYSYVGGGFVEAYSERTEVISAFRYYVFSGGMTLSGSPSKLGRCYLSNGEKIEISGSCEPAIIYGFKPAGGLQITGSIVGTIFDKRKFIADNNDIYIEGQADFNFVNLGLLISRATFYSSYSNVSIEVSDASSEVISVPQKDSVSNCGCVSSPSIILDHNLTNGGVIYDFINRNSGAYLDSRVLLNYKSSSKSWSSTSTLSGFSSQDYNVTWHFIFELSCTNIIDGESFDEDYLKFNFYAKYRNNYNFITNLVVYLNPSQICGSRVLSASIVRSYENENGQYSLLIDSNPISDGFYKIVDNIGIFSDAYWNNNPNYSRLRPQYYSSSESYSYPKVTGIWPEFRINFSNITNNQDYRKITIANPIPIDL